MRKFFLLLHRWLAILLGIFISIMCFTGAIMVFQDEIANYILGVEYSHDVPFFQAVRSLHRFLFIAPANPHEGLSVGRIIMGGSAIAMTLILLSGVVIWWPKTSRMLKNRLAINFHKGWHRFVYDTHVSLGIYTFAFLLLMSLTGPVFSFKSYRNAVISMLSMQEQPGGEYDIQKKRQTEIRITLILTIMSVPTLHSSSLWDFIPADGEGSLLGSFIFCPQSSVVSCL
jgi:Uncharacterized iron-regulated membrane protein